MKIILVNYRYFISGGPERYMFNVKTLLEEKGHTVIPFSIRYKQNQPTPWSRYFVPPLTSEDEVTFSDHSYTIKGFIRTLNRAFYSSEVYRSLKELLMATKPDVALVLNYLKKLSPSVLVALKEQKVPIITRLSDFFMLCPEAHFLRQGCICEKCINGKLWPSVYHRCIKKSFGVSIINACSTHYHRKKKFFDLIDAFITPSSFTKRKMVDGGWPQEKIFHIPTFVNLDSIKPRHDKKPMISYVGRVHEIKGIEILLDAFSLLKKDKAYRAIQLNIIGGGTKPYIDKLKKYIERINTSEIVCYDNLDLDRIAHLLSGSLFSVIPSLCYENMPNAALESFACGTPVIASDLGSLPEIVNSTVGDTFTAGDVHDLYHKMVRLLENPSVLQEMGMQARKYAENNYNPQLHYDRLSQLITKVIHES